MKDIAPESLQKVRDAVKQRFDRSKRVLTFDEYLSLTAEQPQRVLRGSALYIQDAIESFGRETIDIRGVPRTRFRIFDRQDSGGSVPLFGQEQIQSALMRILTGFVRSGRTDKLVVMHGPNGSAKSTLVRNLYAGLESYSDTDDGALYCFSWIFPHDSFEKGAMGIGTRRDTMADVDSYAKLDQDKIGAIVRSELRENPIALIPLADRRALVDTWLQGSDAARAEPLRTAALKTELSHKNALIFEALLDDYKGDLKKVLRHVRVERFYLSRRFRRGLVSIEAQFGVDAQLRQVTLDRSMSMLPPALQSLNLFQLEGDLVDGNRGGIEYNDLLKRPIEAFKYILGTCETGSVTLGHVVAFLDSVFLATTNDRQLDAFREHPEYNSFKARMEFVKAPYLLRYSDEAKIYAEPARKAAGPKELMPHATEMLALFAVLTRLKRPFIKNKPASLVRLLEALTPLAKAKLYDRGEMPEGLNEEERRELKGSIEALIEEQQNQPFYEGAFGASARELKMVLQAAAQNSQFMTLGPNAIIAELAQLVKRVQDFEYLRIEPNQGYHDYEDIMRTVRGEWLDRVDREVQDSLDMGQDARVAEQMDRYMKHVTSFVRKEKVKNRHTGQYEEADSSAMEEFERLVDASGSPEDFRRNLVSRLGAWSIENPGRDATKSLPYETIFPDLAGRIRGKFREQQVVKIRAMGVFITDADSFRSAIDLDAGNTLSEAGTMAIKVYRGLQERFGYGPAGAQEALVELVRARYL